jgi:RHS repeat-associated protein
MNEDCSRNESCTRTKYNYDGAERPISAVDANGNSYALSATYAPQGALQTGTFTATSNFAGFSTTNTYTPRLQPNELKVSNGSNSVMDFVYCFSALVDNPSGCPTPSGDNGNVMQITNKMDGTRSQMFSYDSVNRISVGGSVNTSGTNCWGEQYGYDAWANLKTISFPSSIYNSSCTQWDNLNVGISGQNQINSPSGYGYDAAGNLTAAPGGATYTYNGEGEMAATAGVNYTYDGDGKRVEKSGSALYWYGTGSDALEETNTSGALTNDYIFFGGRRVARRDASGNIFAYFEDHLGSSRKVQEIASGGSTASLSYDADFTPFGREIAYVNTSDPIYKFTGKERDSESGLDNFGARYNSSTMGRFMSPDWSSGAPTVPYADFSDPQSLNLYAYVRNNPLARNDPDGHCTVDGEKHGWLWCALHVVLITQTQKEQKEGDPGLETFRNMFEGAQADLVKKLGPVQRPPMWLQMLGLVTGNPEGDLVQGAEEGANATEIVGEAGSTAPEMTPWGWSGSAKWRAAMSELQSAGTHEDLQGIVPTQGQATEMIQQSGGTVDRVEGPHASGGISTHTYDHINYTTADGQKATIRIQPK